MKEYRDMNASELKEVKWWDLEFEEFLDFYHNGATRYTRFGNNIKILNFEKLDILELSLVLWLQLDGGDFDDYYECVLKRVKGPNPYNPDQLEYDVYESLKEQLDRMKDYEPLPTI